MSTKNKIIIVITILIVGGLIIVLNNYLRTGSSSELPSPGEKQESLRPVSELKATLSFESPSGNYKLGEIFPVNIIADSDGEKIAGLDIMIKYDSSVLELKQQEEKFVATEGDFFIVFPAGGQKENLFNFSLLTYNPKVIKEKIATIYFLAKKATETKLEFLFERGKTNDSNLAAIGRTEDILSSVGEAVLKISEE